MSQIKGDSPLGGRPTHRLRNGLVVAELALSVMLVLSAGLLARSFRNLMSVDPGFKTAGVLKAAWLLPSDPVPSGIRQLPELGNAPSLHQRRPRQRARDSRRHVGGRRRDASARSRLHQLVGYRGPRSGQSQLPRIVDSRGDPGVLPDPRPRHHFRAGLRGNRRTGAPAVVVLNRAAAERFFKNQDPIGQQIRGGGFRVASSVWSRTSGFTGSPRPRRPRRTRPIPRRRCRPACSSCTPTAIRWPSRAQVREAIRAADPAARRLRDRAAQDDAGVLGGPAPLRDDGDGGLRIHDPGPRDDRDLRGAELRDRAAHPRNRDPGGARRESGAGGGTRGPAGDAAHRGGTGARDRRRARRIEAPRGTPVRGGTAGRPHLCHGSCRRARCRAPRHVGPGLACREGRPVEALRRE